MSLSSSLNTAVAGLDISSRRAQIVAQNVANADRTGYARRDLHVGGPSVGMPGSTTSVSREVDPRLVLLRREAQSRSVGEEALATFFTRIDTAVGDPDSPGSLQDAIARLDAAFLTASSSPQSDTRLEEVRNASLDLVKLINTLDQTVTDARQSADADIGQAVAQLNADLADVARLNTDIKRLRLGGNDAADLLDQRGALIDRISEAIPLRELPRDDGSVALVTNGGLLLLDGRPGTLGFDARAPITAEMSFPIQLSGLSLNGRDVATSGASSGIPGGKLAALFRIRDDIAPEATQRLDSLAADLIDRFEDPAVDPTRAPGQPGLFTEAGSPLGAPPDAGLAGRLQVNAGVDPDRDGALWRLRDGLGAALPATDADATLLLAYNGAISDRALPVLSGLPDVPADLIGRAADLKSAFSLDRVQAEDRLSFSRTEATTLAEQRDGGRVDIDAEMRRLIEIEQAYAANARIVQAVGDMINRLTEI